jgi:hypothetical protein
MTLCIVDGGHCNCQPDEGVVCDKLPKKVRDYVLTAVKTALEDAIPREIHDRLVREKDAKIEQLRSALEGVVRVADRKTVEFDAARAALAFEHEQEESPQTAAQLHDWHKRRKPTGNQP